METQSLTEILRALIAENTVNPPGNERSLALVIRDLLGRHGIDSRVDDLGDNRANLLAEIRGGGDGPVLLYYGHLDTVPVKGDWDHDPFAGMVEGGRLVGLGAVDMKGAIASMIGAAVMLAGDRGRRMKGTLLLLFVADEERNGIGTRDFLKRHPKPDYAVIGEPSDLNLVTSNRGVLRLKISTHGVAGHCSNPAAGVNAIYHMADVIGSLKNYAERISAGDRNYHGQPSLSVTTIVGGTAENVIPDACQIAIDRRMIHGESPEKVEAEIVGILERLRAADPSFRYTCRRFEQMPAWKNADDSVLLPYCRSAFEKCFHRKPVQRDLGGTSEAGLYAEAGIDTVIFGPGNISLAHSRNEHLEVEQLARAAEFYRLLAEEILMDGAVESGRK